MSWLVAGGTCVIVVSSACAGCVAVSPPEVSVSAFFCPQEIKEMQTIINHFILGVCCYSSKNHTVSAAKEKGTSFAISRIFYLINNSDRSLFRKDVS
jgi:hypothetical protein